MLKLKTGYLVKQRIKSSIKIISNMILTIRNRNYKIRQFRAPEFSNMAKLIRNSTSDVEKYKEIEKSLAGIKFK